jgi:hypothetical protein
MWALRKAFAPYMKWLAGQKLRPKPRPKLPSMPESLRRHAEFAAAQLQNAPYEISFKTMSKHQLGLADRQCRMSELSQRLQDCVTILCTSLYAARQNDEVVRHAADIVCQDLARKLCGQRPSDKYFKSATKLGQSIVEGGFKSIAGLEVGEILMQYDSK